MYFWKIEDLKREINQTGLAQREQLKYLVATALIDSLASSLPGEPTLIRVIGAFLLLPVIAVGLFHVYRCNGADEGQDFISKTLAIGWVIQIRIVVFSLALLIPLNLVLGLIFGEFSDTQSQLTGIVLTLLLMSILFRQMGIHIAETRGTRSA